MLSTIAHVSRRPRYVVHGSQSETLGLVGVVQGEMAGASVRLSRFGCDDGAERLLHSVSLCAGTYG